MKTAIYVIMFVLLMSIATAISFDNEELYLDITDFKWCFDSPFDNDKEISPEYFQKYVDNVNCEDVNIEIITQKEITEYNEKCDDVYVCRNISHKEEITLNGTIPAYEEESCEYEKLNCGNVPNTYIKDYVLTESTLKKSDRVCVTGKRKAKIGENNCDMNFIYDDGNTSFDVADYGKLWWNATWGKKFNVTAEGVGDGAYLPFYASFNNTLMGCSNNGSDVRIVNSDENATINHEIVSWNVTTGILFINVSVQTGWFGYLYCDASVPSTSINVYSFDEGEFSYYTMDTVDTVGTVGLDAINSYNGELVGGMTSNLSAYYNEGYNALNGPSMDTFITGIPATEMQDGKDWTSSFWLKLDTLNGGVAEGFWGNLQSGGGNQGIGLADAGSTVFNFFTDVSIWTSTGVTITPDYWYHIVITNDWGGASANITFYVNGTQRFSYTDLYTNSAENLSVGSVLSNGEQSFDGLVDDSGFWQRALNKSEVETLFVHGYQYPFYAMPNISVGVEIPFNTTPFVAPPCNFTYSGLCAGCRYMNTEITDVMISCVNTTNCGYWINEYSNITISDCSSFNLSLVRGWNDLNIWANNSNSSGHTSLHVWADDQDGSIWDYSSLIIMLVVAGFLFFMGTRMGIFYVMSGIVVIVLGINLWMISGWIASMVIFGGLVIMFMVTMDSK